MVTQRFPFYQLLHWGVGEGAASLPGLLYFTFDSYLIELCVKQGGIKYHLLSLWYDSTWYWTQVPQAIGKHFTYIYIYIYMSSTDRTVSFYQNSSVWLDSIFP